MSRGIMIAVALSLAVACGGTTTQPPGASGSGPRACTEIGCENGVRVDFSYHDAGAYVFEVTVDGSKVTCKATLPLPKQPPEACDGLGVLLGLVGSMLPADQQSIGGLILLSTTATSVSVHATRDGAVLGDKTFTPPYVTTPGPNGPGCEPNECTLAKVTFP
jgi:hypothetical protein